MTAPRVTVNLTGVKDLVEALKSLPERMEKAVLRGALRKAAKPILTGAKLRAPVQTGVLRDSLKIKSARRNKANKHKVTFTVGTGSGAAAFAGKLFYGGFQELGWLQGKRSHGQKWAQRKIREERTGKVRGSNRTGQKTLADLQKRISDLPVGDKLRASLEKHLIGRARRLDTAHKIVAADNRKKNAGLHYVKRSFDDNSGRAVNELESLIRQGLEREAVKAAKKQAIENGNDTE